MLAPSPRAWAWRRMVGVVGGAVCCALGGAQASELSVVDGLGRVVRVPESPHRIVSIFSSNTDILDALGFADRIVGVESFTRRPQQVAALPKIGGRLGFSSDWTIALRPDLAIMTPARQAAEQMVDPLERVGVPALVLTHRTLSEINQNIRLVATLLGDASRGEAVAQALTARLNAVRSRVAGRAPLRALFIVGFVTDDALLAARPGTYTVDALEIAGGVLAIRPPRHSGQVSMEAALAADPDVILAAGTPDQLRRIAAAPGVDRTQAGRNGRLHVVSRAQFLVPGPLTVDGIETLAATLHPDAFASPLAPAPAAQGATP